MKRTVFILIFILLTVYCYSHGSMESEEQQKEVTIWFWTDFYDRLYNDSEFATLNPDIKIVTLPVESNNYLTKFQATLAGGGDLPDIAVIPVEHRGKLLSLDLWENLENAPYNLDRNLLMDYIIPMSIGVEGGIVGVESGVAVSGLAYKRHLAKKYLGTDSPEEIEKMINNWDKFIQVGLKVLEKSNGEVKMLPGIGDVFTILDKQNPIPPVIDDNLNVDSALRDKFMLVKKMLEIGIVGEVEQWSPAWNNSFSSNEYIFQLCPAWMPEGVIKPNDPEGVGNWGVCGAPNGPYLFGSTLFAIPKAAKNKNEAWRAIEWAFLTREGAEAIRDILNQISIYKPAIEEDGFYSYKDPYFSGQDWLQKLALMTKELEPFKSSEYDNVTFSATMEGLNSIAQGATIDYALQKVMTELKIKIPELK